jgi:cyclophilin family peptidyl-prolyl cis-trans isomerase
LFGKDAPASTAQFKKLLTTEGLLTTCRPRAERVLQKEQLEANKVYNGCKETVDVGVNLKYSTIWRVVKNERIDLGAVNGRFLAREYPEWNDASTLKHDDFGKVSVRKGNDGGFGFSIYSGEGGKNAEQLDEDHIVVGRVIEGMDVVRELNEVPVVSSAKLNYMGLTGGPKSNNAPDRSCRYGGPMYCNENKPLIKLSITETGII